MKQRTTNPRLEQRSAPTAQATGEPPDDFFCQRFRVPYPSIDCAFRTRYRTCPGCDNCDQGRFNLKRHSARVGGLYLCGERRG